MSEIVLLLVLFAPPAIWLWIAWTLWRDWHRHRRIMKILHEVERCAELIRTSQDLAQLRARYERSMELLEHAAEMMKKK